MAEQDRGRATSTRRAGARTEPTTARPVVEPSVAPVATEPPAPVTPPLPAPSPRNGVAVNVGTVRAAFATGEASLSVGYVQHVLRSRGFEPGNVAGVADHDTRVAFARFQESIRQPPTGLPTEVTLDHLGFDVIG